MGRRLFWGTRSCLLFEYPAVEKDEILVIDNNVFYRYLQEASNKFLERNPSGEAEVNELLILIKNKINLS